MSDCRVVLVCVAEEGLAERLRRLVAATGATVVLCEAGAPPWEDAPPAPPEIPEVAQ